MMNKGWPFWDGDELPALTHFTIPDDIHRFAQRLREVFNQQPPNDPCDITWLYPRDRMPSLTSPIPDDLRRFFARVREALVRCPIDVPKEELEPDCYSPEGRWVTTPFYPIEHSEFMRSRLDPVLSGYRIAVQRGNDFITQGRLLGGFIENIFDEVDFSMPPEQYITQGRLLEGRILGQLEHITERVAVSITDITIKQSIRGFAPPEELQVSITDIEIDLHEDD